MSAENKKLLWISISACVFVLVLAGTGFFLFAPRKGGATAPATIGNTAAPKAADPQDFLQAPPPLPAADQTKGPDGGVVVIYGDKPAPPPLPAAPANPAALAGAVPAAAAPANPAAAKAITKAPAPVPAKAALPPKTTKKVKVSEYWIQAASFSSRGRADELRDLLAAKGIATLISVKDIDGKSWYRVRVGPYTAKTEAEGWLGRLKGLPNCSEAYVAKNLVERSL